MAQKICHSDHWHLSGILFGIPKTDRTAVTEPLPLPCWTQKHASIQKKEEGLAMLQHTTHEREKTEQKAQTPQTQLNLSSTFCVPLPQLVFTATVLQPNYFVKARNSLENNHSSNSTELPQSNRPLLCSVATCCGSHPKLVWGKILLTDPPLMPIGKTEIMHYSVGCIGLSLKDTNWMPVR